MIYVEHLQKRDDIILLNDIILTNEDTTNTSDLISLSRLYNSPQITLSADFTLNTTAVHIHKFIDFDSTSFTLTLNLPAFKE